MSRSTTETQPMPKFILKRKRALEMVNTVSQNGRYENPGEIDLPTVLTTAFVFALNGQMLRSERPEDRVFLNPLVRTSAEYAQSLIQQTSNNGTSPSEQIEIMSQKLPDPIDELEFHTLAQGFHDFDRRSKAATLGALNRKLKRETGSDIHKWIDLETGVLNISKIPEADRPNLEKYHLEKFEGYQYSSSARRRIKKKLSAESTPPNVAHNDSQKIVYLREIASDTSPPDGQLKPDTKVRSLNAPITDLSLLKAPENGTEQIGIYSLAEMGPRGNLGYSNDGQSQTLPVVKTEVSTDPEGRNQHATRNQVRRVVSLHLKRRRVTRNTRAPEAQVLQGNNSYAIDGEDASITTTIPFPVRDIQVPADNDSKVDTVERLAEPTQLQTIPMYGGLAETISGYRPSEVARHLIENGNQVLTPYKLKLLIIAEGKSAMKGRHITLSDPESRWAQGAVINTYAGLVEEVLGKNLSFMAAIRLNVTRLPNSILRRWNTANDVWQIWANYLRQGPKGIVKMFLDAHSILQSIWRSLGSDWEERKFINRS